MYDPQFITEYLSGQASETQLMVKLMAQVFVILVIGIVLWRISAMFGKKKTKTRRKNMFTDSNYQTHWKKR